MSNKFFALVVFLLSVTWSSAADYTVTTVECSGIGSFQEAIIAANNSSLTRPFEIVFAIPEGSVINCTSLEAFTRPVLIDGTKHPAYIDKPVIIISGVQSGTGYYERGIGFFTGSERSTVRGLYITGYKFGVDCKASGSVIEKNTLSGNIHAIQLRSYGKDIIVRANNIGTNNLGDVRHANTDGILIENTTNVIIGGDSPADGNVISGSVYKGIWVKSGNVNLKIKNNKIGTSKNGSSSISNADGVFFDNANSSGTVYLENNLISGNLSNGIFINKEEGTVNIKGNIIGLNVGGQHALSNPYGIFTNSCNGILNIGGASPSDRNVISGNTSMGVFFRNGTVSLVNNYIGVSSDGLDIIPNGTYGIFIASAKACTIGGLAEGEGNVVAGHNLNTSSVGIFILQSPGTKIIGNKVGVNAAGEIASNHFGGYIESSDTVEIINNVLSGSVRYNLHLETSHDCKIKGNKIGTNQEGTAAALSVVSPDADGINLYSSNRAEIGGSLPEDANVISGNHNGIYATSSTHNIIQNNKIGTDITGEIAIGNSNGIYTNGGEWFVIEGNIISGNRAAGVIVNNTYKNYINENKIGVSVSGKALGNGEEGILLRSASNNSTIRNNTVGDNYREGIVIEGGSSSNVLKGNFIGTDASGQVNIRNRAHGIKISGSSQNNTIGGIGAGEANKIAYNLGDGVLVSGSLVNLISGNTIFRQSGKGINLLLADGVSENDGNSAKARPVVTSVMLNSGLLEITGTSTGHKDTIQFFVSDADGEDGFKFLGSYTAFTNGTTWSTTIPFTEVSGGYIVATATDTLRNTSEFSVITGITNCPTIVPTFSIAIPCPDKPLITGNQVLFSATNFENGFLYDWNMEGDVTPEVVATTADTYYAFYSAGIKDVTVSQRIANCSITSAPQSVEVKELRIDADNAKLCEGQVANLSVTPSDLLASDYVWYRNDVLLDHTGPSLQVDNYGIYKIVVQSWSCDGETTESTVTVSSTSSTAKIASKEVVVVERICGTGVGCGSCLPPFMPESDKTYIFSAWVHEDAGVFMEKYERAGVKLDFHVKDAAGDVIKDFITAPVFTADGPIIDGWQRIEKAFTVPPGTVGIDLTLQQSPEVDIYYDDIRMHPYDGNARTFVYDPETLRLMAILDENNFATFYEYDQEGKLIRVKKETERGVMTIQENMNNIYKRDHK